MEESFQNLIDKKLKSAKPLSPGIGLFRKPQGPPRPSTDRLEVPPGRLAEIPIKREATLDQIQQIAQNVEQLKEQAVEIEQKLQSRPWLGQAMDLLCVWVLFLLFPLVATVVLPLSSNKLLFQPTVFLLFTAFYLFLLSGYLWLFHFLNVPTVGMRFQNMDEWPSKWSWSSQRIIPAFRRALGHLTLDALWRKP